MGEVAKQWLSITEVAELLGVSGEHVRCLIDSGRLEAVDVSLHPGRKRATWRVSAEAIEKFVAQRTNIKPERSARRRPSTIPVVAGLKITKFV
jgi:excisionase family DNA binding protein